MRVLNCLFDGRFGGPPKRVLEVARRLRDHDVETVVVLPLGDGNAAARLSAGGVGVRLLQMEPLPYPRDVRRCARWIARVRGDVRRFENLFRAERPDIVHVNGAAFLPPAMASRRAGIPLVWHLNDTLVPRGISGLNGRFVRSLADKVVVAAEAVAVHYGLSKLPHEVIYAPVNISRFAPLKGNLPTESSAGDWRVGLIANWNPLKGHADFLQAMAIARERIGEPLKLDLAGAKLDTQRGYGDRIETMIDDCGVREILVDHGFVDDVESVLSRLDLLVLASTSEACPMVVLEAMASGVPVVATDVGGVREILTDGPDEPAGIVVPPRDPVAMADAVVAMYQDPSKFRTLARNGRHRAEHHFSLASCAQRHLVVYESIVDTALRQRLSPPRMGAGRSPECR